MVFFISFCQYCTGSNLLAYLEVFRRLGLAVVDSLIPKRDTKWHSQYRMATMASGNLAQKGGACLGRGITKVEA